MMTTTLTVSQVSVPKILIASLATVASAFAINTLLFTTKNKHDAGSGDNVDNTAVQRPPHVFSMIPYVGSAVEMGKDITSFIRKYGKKLQSPIFTATILGKKCLFIADPELLTIVYKPSLSSAKDKKIDDTSLQKQFMTNALGMTKDEVGSALDPVGFKDSLRQYHKHLLKAEYLEVTIGKVQQLFRSMIIPSLDEAMSTDGGTTEQHLYRFIRTAVFKASVSPFLSPTIATDEAAQAFKDFDEGATLLFQDGIPSFVTQVARAGRDRLLHLLQTDQFWETAAPLMVERKESKNVTGSALDKANLGLLWASSGNSAPAVFWTFLHLINDRVAWNACYEQVKEVAKTRDHVFSLEDLDKLTRLQSAFWEALRLYHGAFTSRTVVNNFVLDATATNHEPSKKKEKTKFLIEKDTQIMSFWNILHSDPDVFENPDEFIYDRFLNRDKPSDFSFASGTPLKAGPVIAFGGGQHLCPGRRFIAYENRLLLAMIIMTYDVQLPSTETIPSIDNQVQGIGVSQPKHDVVVTFKYRS